MGMANLLRIIAAENGKLPKANSACNDYLPAAKKVTSAATMEQDDVTTTVKREDGSTFFNSPPGSSRKEGERRSQQRLDIIYFKAGTGMAVNEQQYFP